MFAGTKSHACVKNERGPAGGRCIGQVGTPDRETASDQLLRECGTGALQPPVRLRWRARNGCRHSGHRGSESQRTGQFIVFGAYGTHTLEPPCAAGVITEKANRFACTAKRRFIGLQCSLRHGQAETFKQLRVPVHASTCNAAEQSFAVMPLPLSCQ